MGYYVHLSVVFACDHNEPLAALAKKHRPLLDAHEYSESLDEAKWFLDALSVRTGENLGPKGGLCTWGMVGNYTKADDFVSALCPFFLDVYRDWYVPNEPPDRSRDRIGLCGHEHIIVFWENEQSEYANCIEIGLVDDRDPSALRLTMHERLPFAWMQF